MRLLTYQYIVVGTAAGIGGVDILAGGWQMNHFVKIGIQCLQLLVL